MLLRWYGECTEAAAVAVFMYFACFIFTAAEDENGAEEDNEYYDGEDGDGKEKHRKQGGSVFAGKQRRSTQPLVACFKPKQIIWKLQILLTWHI